MSGKKIAADGHEYHVSKTANATVAPTNEFTKQLAATKATGGLGSERAEFVTLVHYEFGLRGDVDADHIKKEYSYTDKEFNEYINDPAIQQALIERGVAARLLNQDAPKQQVAKLTHQQLIVANMLMDITDNRTTRKKLQDQNVTTATYQMWMRDPNFKGYLQQRAENLIGDVQHEAMLSLVDKVMAGDLKAIQYYHEITGRFVQANTAGQANTSNHNIEQMIVRIIEIVVDEVDDQETGLRIAERLKGLVMGNQVAGLLPVGSPHIIQPEIAQGREMTPEIQGLIAKGAGYND